MDNHLDVKMRVLIVDDHAIVRQGLRTLLELIPDIHIAGEVGNGKDAVGIVDAVKPDVILMDLKMPEMDGITATREICAKHPGIKVIALTSFLEDESLIPAIQAGAFSFLLKDVQPSELIETIRAAYKGEARLNSAAARKLMDSVVSNVNAVPKQKDGISGREIDVLKLITQGKCNKDIAAELVISEKTVKSHVSSLLSKLNLSDRTQLAIYALQNKLFSNDD